MKGCYSQRSQYEGMLKSNKSIWRDVSQISQCEGMLKSNKSIWRDVIVKEVNMKGC